MRLLLPLLLVAAVPALAETLALPVACALGSDCWVMNYADDDPGPEARDFRCGRRAYDGHDGTDFAVADAAAAARGVAVLAAAAGVVQGARDDEPEGAFVAGGRAAVRGKECGNGLRLQHADGFETQYCHLKAGSLRVKAGDRVERGQPLGLVGMSGMSEFPHLHLTVRRAGKALDPFTGLPLSAGCGHDERPLWSAPVPYQATSLYAAGFADHLPTAAEVKADTASPAKLGLGPQGALVVWGAAFGAQPGDVLSLRILGPDGAEWLRHDAPFDRAQAWAMRSAGLKAGSRNFVAGTYTGEAILLREGKTVQSRTVMVAKP